MFAGVENTGDGVEGGDQCKSTEDDGNKMQRERERERERDTNTH